MELVPLDPDHFAVPRLEPESAVEIGRIRIRVAGRLEHTLLHIRRGLVQLITHRGHVLLGQHATCKILWGFTQKKFLNKLFYFY